jgi:hypothetical protein
VPGDNFGYVGHELVLLEDGTYRWVDIKRFWLPVRLAAPALGLELLLGHVRYRDPYTGPPSRDVDAEDIHGPYRLEQISVRSYEVIDEATALMMIQDFVGNADELSNDVRADLDFRVFRQIQRMPARYRLLDLGEDAFHDFGWVLRGFTELVVMDVSRSELLLLVAAGD